MLAVRRHLSNVAAAVSAIVCISAAVLCMRSYVAQDIVVLSIRCGDETSERWRYWRLVRAVVQRA